MSEVESTGKSSGLKGLLLTRRNHNGVPSLSQGNGERTAYGSNSTEPTEQQQQHGQNAAAAAAKLSLGPTDQANSSKPEKVPIHAINELDPQRKQPPPKPKDAFRPNQESESARNNKQERKQATKLIEPSASLAQAKHVSSSEKGTNEETTTSLAAEQFTATPTIDHNQNQVHRNNGQQKGPPHALSSNRTTGSGKSKSPSKRNDSHSQPRPSSNAHQHQLSSPTIHKDNHHHHHHQHKASHSMQTASSPSSSLQAQLQSDSSYGSSVAAGQPFSLHHMMLIGLPLFSFIMFALVICFVLNCCKRDRKNKKQTGPSWWSYSSKRSKRNNLESSPIGFISNGKLFGHSQDLSSSGLEAVATTSPSSSSAVRDARKALDCRQLTINMEGDCSTEDSDEQLNERTKSPPQPKPKPGKLKYGLEYDFQSSTLSVSILEAQGLPGMDLNGSSDPYVKVYMVCNKAQMFRTKIHKRTLNPVFNETFKFKLAHGELTKQTLVLSVYDYDRLSRHDEIGHLALPMSSIDLAQRQENWSELRKSTETTDGPHPLGDICLSLRYVPTAGKLNVVVLEARQLKKMDLAGLSDPYVKLALMSDGKRMKKKKTSIKKCTLNPHYNESFSFEIPFEMAQKVQLVITVVDYDRIGTSEPIGKITLGAEQTTGKAELRHWMDMLASPRRPIARWHSLKRKDFEETTPVGGASGGQERSSNGLAHVSPPVP